MEVTCLTATASVAAHCSLPPSYGESLEAGLHFINLPIVEGSTVSPIVPPDNSTHGGHNVAWAVGALAATLRSQKAVPLDRARALLLLIHLVGDVHQPLHAATAVSARWPQGDQGGNKFPVSVHFDPTVQSLHQLFDSGCGLWNRQVAQHRPLRGDDAAWLEKWAQNVTAEVPPPEEPFQELPYWWAQESWQLASDIAYAGLARPEEGAEPAVPSPAYVQTAQRALIARAARAGYRLADLLNDALAPTKSGLLGQAAAAAGGSRPRASGAVVVPR